MYAITINNVEKIRKYLGLTQEELAIKLGLKGKRLGATIADWEGKTKRPKKLKDKYKIILNDLLLAKQMEESVVEESAIGYGNNAMDSLQIEFARVRQSLAKLEIGYQQMKQRLAQYETV